MSRLVLFDPDWNPAVDQQALARVWRSGQTKPCYVYRFFATGSIEEVTYERQCSKEGLSNEIVDGDGDGRKFSTEELKYAPLRVRDRRAMRPAAPRARASGRRARVSGGGGSARARQGAAWAWSGRWCARWDKVT